MGGLSDARPANQFGPISPEQQAMLQRGAVQETISPLDLLTLLYGAGIGGVGYGAGRLMGLSRPQSLGVAGVSGGSAAGRFGNYLNGSQDAEGQPGGFYGQMPRR